MLYTESETEKALVCCHNFVGTVASCVVFDLLLVHASCSPVYVFFYLRPLNCLQHTHPTVRQHGFRERAATEYRVKRTVLSTLQI